MKIAVIGAGRVGATLGARWAAVGHAVVFGVRDPDDDKYAPLRPYATLATPSEAVGGADVVLLALPWGAMRDVTVQLDVGSAVVIDASNPLASGSRVLDSHPELSGAELVAGWLRTTRMVKAFNTTGSGNMSDPVYPAGVPVMPVAGDDADAKAAVLTLAREIGFDGVDAGPLSAARDLEHLAMLWIRMAYTLGQGPDMAFSLIRR